MRRPWISPPPVSVWRPCLLVLLLPLACPEAVVSQEGSLDLAKGDRVRAFSENLLQPAVGTYLGLEQETLLLRPDRGREPLRLYLDLIERLERQTEGGTLGFGQGAMIGVGVALVGGLALSAVGGGEGANMAMAGALLVGAPVGALVGGMIGENLRSSRWEPVPVPEPEADTGAP